MSAVQVSPSELIVECHNTEMVFSVKSELPIKGVFVTREDLAVWSGKKLAIYAFSQDKPLVRNAGTELVKRDMVNMSLLRSVVYML